MHDQRLVLHMLMLFPMVLKLNKCFNEGLEICMCFFHKFERFFFFTFLKFLTFIFFHTPILQKCIGSRYFVKATPPRVFETSQVFKLWSKDMRGFCAFFRFLNIFIFHF